MSEKRMVYAEDVIKRIRDLAPEILGGWYNPDMENELEQLVCIVESTPTAANTDVQRWRKTAENPPKAEDADPRSATVLTVQVGVGFVTAWEWHIVADFPEEFPLWMPMPELPEELKK